ncbi:MAG: hypothetical protein GAK45_00509 [Pseudomonas citronellolis]|nr:MAG: hypothetical protein GAK45_00509 [Pseudomonas citronellolis]
MNTDALRSAVPAPLTTAELPALLAEARRRPPAEGLQACIELLHRLNHCGLTLLERQRSLQSLTQEHQYYQRGQSTQDDQRITDFCGELAQGYQHLVEQILNGHNPSRPHLAWGLCMAQYFIGQAMLLHYLAYRQPPAALWADSHRLYRLGERLDCLDEPVATAFTPAAAGTLRGLHHQPLLLALSNPFQLISGEAALLYAALASLADLTSLEDWNDEDTDALRLDLDSDAPVSRSENNTLPPSEYTRSLELGAVYMALETPTPLRSEQAECLLQSAAAHWSRQPQRRHVRQPQNGQCQLIAGLSAIHAHLQHNDDTGCTVEIADTSADGARLRCPSLNASELPIGQLLLVLAPSGGALLALVRWVHLDGAELNLGIHYLKGIARPAWISRAPGAQLHAALLQSSPQTAPGWQHGLWLPHGSFYEGERVWLQLASAQQRMALVVPPANRMTRWVCRYLLPTMG